MESITTYYNRNEDAQPIDEVTSPALQNEHCIRRQTTRRPAHSAQLLWIINDYKRSRRDSWHPRVRAAIFAFALLLEVFFL